jgi:hypothetical protein
LGNAISLSDFMTNLNLHLRFHFKWVNLNSPDFSVIFLMNTNHRSLIFKMLQTS